MVSFCIVCIALYRMSRWLNSNALLFFFSIGCEGLCNWLGLSHSEVNGFRAFACLLPFAIINSCRLSYSGANHFLPLYVSPISTTSLLFGLQYLELAVKILVSLNQVHFGIGLIRARLSMV